MTKKIPHNWKQVKIADIPVTRGLVRGPFGGSLKKSSFVSEGFKVYEQKNAIYQSYKLGSYFIDEKKFSELKRFEVLPGDFIVSCSGTIGRIYQIPQKAPKGVINQALLKIRVNPEVIRDKYFYYHFSWDRFQSKVIDNTQGGAMQNLVGMDIFKNTKLLLPPLPEQHRIVAVLETWDQAIQVLTHKIQIKRNIKKGLMQQLLTGKKRLPGFDGEWENYELGEVLDYEQPQQYIVDNDEYNDSYQTPVLTAGKSLILGYTNETSGICTNTPVIIFDDFTTANKFVNFDFKVKSSAMKLLRSKNNDLFNIRFIYERMQLIQYIVGEHKRKYISEYQYLSIKIPEIEEQNAIANILTTTDDEITALEKKKHLLEEQKKYLLNNLITGQILTPENLTMKHAE